MYTVLIQSYEFCANPMMYGFRNEILRSGFEPFIKMGQITLFYVVGQQLSAHVVLAIFNKVAVVIWALRLQGWLWV